MWQYCAMHCAEQYIMKFCQITKEIIWPRFCLLLIILDSDPYNMSNLSNST